MEVKVRSLDPTVVTVIDDRAKEQNKSRNEYLKDLLTNVSHNFAMRDERKDYEKVLTRVADALELTHERLENTEKMIEKVYLLNIMLSGMSFEEVERTLGTMIQRKVD